MVCMYVCMYVCKYVWYVCMVCIKPLNHNLDESGMPLPWPLNTTGRINTINTTGRINTTANRDYVEASGN